jgi:hypothetical protein
MYPENWKQIATFIKESSNWRCSNCGRPDLRPGEKPPELTGKRRAYTLRVHHSNRDLLIIG